MNDVSPSEFEDLKAHVAACGARYKALSDSIENLQDHIAGCNVKVERRVARVEMWLVTALGAAFVELLAITIALFLHFGSNH